MDVPTALGEEITGGNLNFRSQGGKRAQEAAYHGVNAKDEEVEIDWKNYYQAVDTFLREELDNAGDYPLYLCLTGKSNHV